MQTASLSDFVSVQDYLAAEESSPVRHEYLGGLIYAMAGETRAHNTICLNLAISLREHLKGKPCKLYMSDIRVNFDIRHDEYFYYPDVVVTCDARDTDPRFVRHPKLIIEVLSESTARVDRREKHLAYTTIESLEEYVLVAQAAREVTVFRRTNGWGPQTITGNEATLMLESLAVSLPFGLIYEGV